MSNTTNNDSNSNRIWLSEDAMLKLFGIRMSRDEFTRNLNTYVEEVEEIQNNIAKSSTTTIKLPNGLKGAWKGTLRHRRRYWSALGTYVFSRWLLEQFSMNPDHPNFKALNQMMDTVTKTNIILRKLGGTNFAQVSSSTMEIFNLLELPLHTPVEPNILLNKNTGKILPLFQQHLLGVDCVLVPFIDYVVMFLRRRRNVGISPEDRPAFILLTGSASAGKNTMLELLTGFLGIADTPAFISVSGNMYQSAESVSLLIGSSLGYEGGEIPCLADRLEYGRQYTEGKNIPLVLFIDEYQMCHASPHNIFRQLIDQGTIPCPRRGNMASVTVTNILIIAAANYGRNKIDDYAFGQFDQQLPLDVKTMEDYVEDDMRTTYKMSSSDSGRLHPRIVCPPMPPSERKYAITSIVRKAIDYIMYNHMIPHIDVQDNCVEAIVQFLLESYDHAVGLRGSKHTVVKYLKELIAQIDLELFAGPTKLEMNGTFDINTNRLHLKMKYCNLSDRSRDVMVQLEKYCMSTSHSPTLAAIPECEPLHTRQPYPMASSYHSYPTSAATVSATASSSTTTPTTKSSHVSDVNDVIDTDDMIPSDHPMLFPSLSSPPPPHQSDDFASVVDFKSDHQHDICDPIYRLQQVCATPGSGMVSSNMFPEMSPFMSPTKTSDTTMSLPLPQSISSVSASLSSSASSSALLENTNSVTSMDWDSWFAPTPPTTLTSTSSASSVSSTLPSLSTSTSSTTKLDHDNMRHVECSNAITHITDESTKQRPTTCHVSNQVIDYSIDTKQPATTQKRKRKVAKSACDVDNDGADDAKSSPSTFHPNPPADNSNIDKSNRNNRNKRQRTSRSGTTIDKCYTPVRMSTTDFSSMEIITIVEYQRPSSKKSYQLAIVDVKFHNKMPSMSASGNVSHIDQWFIKPLGEGNFMEVLRANNVVLHKPSVSFSGTQPNFGVKWKETLHQWNSRTDIIHGKLVQPICPKYNTSGRMYPFLEIVPILQYKCKLLVSNKLVASYVL